MFLTACFIVLDRQRKRMTVYNAGMHPLLLFRDGLCIEGPISTHTPLGIIKEVDFERLESSMDLQENDRIYLYSDGVYETQASSGQFFGYENLHSALLEIALSGLPLANIQETLEQFRGEVEQKDDITLVEILI